jgi:hypothetical protein
MLNIVGIFKPMFSIIPTFECSSSPTIGYYVEMPYIFTTPTNNHKENQLVVNLEDLTLELNDLIGPNQTQEVFGLANLLSLPRLLTRKRECKKPLVDYYNSHMVTLDQYLAMLKHKAMDKEVVDKVKELKTKKKEERRSRKVEGTFTQAERTFQRRIEKDNRTKFNDASSIVIKALGERFHNNLKLGW